MKFTVNRKELLDALTFVKVAVSTRPTHPVLGTFHLVISDNVATITGFDLTTGAQVAIPLETSIDGQLCLPLKALDAIARIRDERITISLDGEQVRIQGVKADIALGTYSPEDYPKLPELTAQRITLDGQSFHTAVDAVAPFASDDETRQVLTGVCFTAKEGYVELAATDGHRLATSRLEGQLSAERLVIPAKALRLLPKKIKGEIAIGISDDNVLFDIDGKVLISRRLSGVFPPYEQLIPHQFSKKILVSHNDLAEVLNVVTIVQTDKTPAVTISATGDNLDLSCENDGAKAQDSTPIILEGDAIDFAVNGKYLGEALRGFTGDLTISLNQPSTPLVITSSDQPDTIHLMMPIQIVR